MTQKLKQFKARHPFTSLMLTAIAFRLLAVILVPGFGAHFLEWLKPGIGIGDSQGMMFLSRVFYATVSLFTVSMVYRITDLLANNKDKAWNIALLPAICVIMPSFGIIDNVSFFLGLPLLLYGSNIVLRQQVLRDANLSQNVHRSSFIIAGVMLGLSICVWYASALVVLCILIMLGMKRNYQGLLMTLIGLAVILLLIGALLLLFHVNPCQS